MRIPLAISGRHPDYLSTYRDLVEQNNKPGARTLVLNRRIPNTLIFVTTPVDTGSERLADGALAITDDLLGAAAHLIQRLHRTVQERRFLHDARRGVLGEPRDGDYIRDYADELRQS